MSAEKNSLRDERFSEPLQGFKSLFKNAPIGMAIFDFDGKFQDFNDNYSKIFGYNPDELRGMFFKDITHPDDWDDDRMLLQAFQENKITAAQKEKKYIHKDGHIIWAKVSVSSIKDKGGSNTGFLSIVEDIAETKDMLTRYKKYEQEYRSLFEQNPDLVFSLDLNGYFTSVNQTAQVVSGFNEPELMKMHFSEVCLRDEIERISGLFKEALEGKTFNFDVSIISKQGKQLMFNVTNMPIVVDGKLSGIYGIAKDITATNRLIALKNLQKNILELNQRSEISLINILSAYIREIEMIFPGMMCNLLKIENNRLHNWVLSSLPEQYLRSIDNLEIADNTGSCGTAAYHKNPVFAADMETDPRCAKFRDIALKEGLRACWSFPVLNSRNEVICILDLYFRMKREPDAEELLTIEQAINLLKLIIENRTFEQSLAISNEKNELINKTFNGVLWDWDVDKNEILYSEGIGKLFGYNEESRKLIRRPVPNHVFMDDWEKVKASFEKVLSSQNNTWTSLYRFVKKDHSILFVKDEAVIIRNKEGKPIRVIGTIQNITEARQQEIENSLWQKIQKVFADEKKLNDCLRLTLIEICKCMNTDLGELWVPNYLNSECNRLALYINNGSADQSNHQTKFIDNNGMVGKIWKTKCHINLDNIDQNEDFLKKDFAKEFQLKSATGFPIIFDNKVLAVFSFFSKKTLSHSGFVDFSDVFLRNLAEVTKRKKTEDEYEKIFSLSPDILCVCGLDGYFKKISSAAVKILGYSVQELMSKPFFDFIHPDDRKKSYEELEKLAAGTSSNYIEKRYITKEGNVILLSWTFELLAEEGLVYAVGRDITERRGMEKMIEAEQNRFTKMFVEAPVSMCILKGRNHVFSAANNQYYRLTGRNKQIIGKTVREVFPEVAGQGYYEWLDQVFNAGETFSSVETPLRLNVNGDGKLTDQYISFMYQPFHNDAGGVEGIFYFGVDVTEQVLARKKIEESEERFRVIFEQAAVGVAMVETNTGKLVRVNEKYCDIFGYTADELSGMTFMEFTHPDDLPTDLLNMKKLLDGAIAEFTMEKRHFKKDGSIIWISLSVSPMWKKGTQPIHHIAIVQDITELKKTEFELEKLSLIAKKTVNPVIITTTERNIEWVNDAFTTVTGYSADEAIGKNIEDLLHGDLTSPVLKKYINERINLKEPFECEIIKYSKQGEPFWVEVKGQTLLNKQGEVTHYFDIETDITERKLAFRKLEEKETKIRKFAKQLNHVLEEERTRIAREIHDEFGQQLSGLKMSLASLTRSVNLKENEIIREILVGVERSIQSLRKISTELRPSILDTMGLIPSLEWLMTEFQKKSGITCKCNIQPGIKPFDKNTAICIFRICQEALTNISKHAAATTVWLNVSTNENELVFSICDNGIGFDNSNMYKPFSMGILSMQERANLIGADFEISGNENKGTCVTIKLFDVNQ